MGVVSMVNILEPGNGYPNDVEEKKQVHVFRIRSLMHVLQKKELQREEYNVDH